MKLGFLNDLRFRVTLVFLLTSMVPLGVVSVFAVRTADRAIESIVTNQLENVAAEKQELLQRWIAERKADVEVVAGSAAVGSMDPAQIAPYLELVRRQYGVYIRFVVAAGGGPPVYDSRGGAEGDCRAESWYQQALRGRPYMSQVHLEPGGPHAVFLLASPIPGAGAAPRGAVCATVNTQAILARVLRVSLGETGECYLVDDQGTFLAHQQPQRILKENIAQTESFRNIFGGSGPRPVYTDYRGIPVLGASRSVEGTQWYVVVEQDRDEAFAASQQLKRHIYAVIAVTVLGVLGLSWLAGSYVAAPIRALSEAARALTRGDFETPLLDAPTARRDEIGTLYSAFVHMARRLRERHYQLEKRVGTARAELRRADVRLKQTLEAAARSEHLAALGRLASGVAHEIRTPLSSLKLFLQSVEEELSASPERAEDLRIALRQVLRIEATINHFLDFARPREPVLLELDFGRLLDDALAVVQPRANQQEVEVNRFVAPALPKVQGDTRQLGGAVVNLLVNALEAMPGRGRLSVSVEPATDEPGSPEQPWARIDVADTGPGITAGDLDRLFEPFFTTKASGSGLGLAIVNATVEGHGGSVKVRTQPGVGTTFSIFLPPANA